MTLPGPPYWLASETSAIYSIADTTTGSLVGYPLTPCVTRTCLAVATFIFNGQFGFSRPCSDARSNGVGSLSSKASGKLPTSHDIIIIKLPGFLSPSAGLKFADIPNGLAAVAKVPVAGWAQIAAYFGFVEFSGGFDDYKTGTPGDYGFKVLTSSDPAEKTKKLSAELANGRLAMMAIIGMFFQDGLTGSAWGDWANYTASPLRAFENELGVQAPVGFWDPAGFTADGSVENFKRRRATEIKHGRISMLATMGYITPEITGKFPGYLSPSAGLKFADVPNGLAAISKVPAAGWAQILAYMAFCEVSQDQSPGTDAYAGDFGFKVLTASDPAEKTKKLNAEIANGRLAMMAIIGMFFQDGLTGSAWGDWANYTASPLRAFKSA